MEKSGAGSVSKEFPARAAEVFGFLADEFGLVGPEHETIVLPQVSFMDGKGLRYRVKLDIQSKIVITNIEIGLPSARIIASLQDLVAASGLGKREDVRKSAHNARGLKQSLES